MTREHRHAAISLACISVLHGSNHGYSIFLSALNEELRGFFEGASIAGITALKTTYLAVYAASNLVVGALASRISARWSLAIGALVNALPVAAFMLLGPGDLAYLHLLWALAAVGAGTYHPVANLLVTRMYPERKGWVLGITGIGASAGFTGGPLLTGFLARSLGLSWQSIAVAVACTGLAVAATTALLVRDVEDEAAAPAAAAANPAGARWSAGAIVAVGCVILAAGLREISTWGVMDVSDFYLTSAFGGRVETAWYLALFFAPGVLVQPLSGWLSDRVGRRLLAAAAFVTHAAGVAAIAFTPPAVLFMPYLVLGLGQAASVPAVEALVADYTSAGNRGFVFGILVTFGLGMGALGPLVAGLLVDALGGGISAFRVCLLLLAAATLAGAGVLLFSGARRR